MEANEYTTNHLDSDVLLPPRKRLLAGLKRQSSESNSQSSPENPSTFPLSDYDIRLQNLLKSNKNGPHMSPEEIAKAAEMEAVNAAKAAEAARALAEEKAVIAAKAIAAAKDALSKITIFSKESGYRDGHFKKNKMKKHVPVQHLYKEQDEELAHKLHRAMNSSPRITKHIPSSKNKHKRHKPSFHLEDIGLQNGVMGDDDHLAEDMNSEGSYVAKGISGEADSSRPKEKLFESPDAIHSNSRKRGRIKQKKLPLSLCSFKDRANPKDEFNHTQATREKPSTGNTSSVKPCANTLSVY